MGVTNTDLKYEIINQLKTLPVCKPNSTMRNWVVRCPYCGDSKTANHGHFSILIDTNSDAPMLYRCLRCNESGLLIPQVLEDLGLGYSQEVNQRLITYNRISGNSSFFKDRVKNFITPRPADVALNHSKLLYLNLRLGTNLTLDDCAKYKIVLSFSEFIRANNIPIGYTLEPGKAMIKPGTARALDEKYLGFVSANNNKITFRDCSKNQSGFFGRYYKVTLDPLNRSPNTFYSLMNQFNLLYTEPIDIHIAEGTFDILSIFLNLERPASQNSLFFASCGYGFGTILKYLIYTGVTTDITVHVYSDSDKTDKDHLQTFSKPFYQAWIDRVVIHRNSFPGEKDFGVPKLHIQDYSYFLNR